MIVIGAALLVLPGPGLLVMLAGLIILSLEFEWARRHRDNARLKLKQMTDEVKRRQREQRESKSTNDVDRAGNHQRKRKS